MVSEDYLQYPRKFVTVYLVLDNRFLPSVLVDQE